MPGEIRQAEYARHNTPASCGAVRRCGQASSRPGRVRDGANGCLWFGSEGLGQTAAAEIEYKY